jgi:TrpR-related protein YerC/YecD
MAGETWQTDDTGALFAAILGLKDAAEAERFFRDLCTIGELHDMAQRWAVARMLDEGLHYADISRRTGASTATITRIASWLNHGEGGYRSALDRLAAWQGAGVKAHRAKAALMKAPVKGSVVKTKKAGPRRSRAS